MFRSALFLTTFGLLSYGVTATASTTVSRYKAQEETARTEYNWTVTCPGSLPTDPYAPVISYHLEVKASKTKIKEDGTPSGTGIATITYSISNFCNLPALTQNYWYGESTAFALQIPTNLDTARFTAPAFPVTELIPDGMGGLRNGATVNLNVDVQWLASDPTERDAYSDVVNEAGYHQVSKFKGKYRLANATGTVWDGTKNLLPSNLEWGFSQIMQLTSAEVTVVKD
jgi:hypothetical protein